MASLKSVDEVLKQRTVAAIKKYDSTIRRRIVAEAKKQGHDISDKNIKKIEFIQFVGLDQTVKPTFGQFSFKEVKVPTFVDTANINNNSPGQIERVVNYGEGETREFNWSVTAGVTVGATVTEEVGIPGLSAKVSMNMQMSVSATTGQAWSDHKDWSSSTKVTVPAYSTVHIQALLTRQVGDLPFVVKVVKDGGARCRVTLSYHGTRTRTFDVALGQLLKVAERTFEARGKITGACGVSCDINATGRKLTGAEKQSLPEGVSTDPASLGTLRL